MSRLLLFVCFFHLSAAADNIYINTNGGDGSSGRDGSSFSGRGGGGTDAEDGDNAKAQDLLLTESGDQLFIRGKAGERMIDLSQLNEYQRIVLSAIGGDGGKGGDGGDGEVGRDGIDGRDGSDGWRGRRGRDGRNGTRFSPDGEDGRDGWTGEPGEDGRDGTDATSGYDGGSGGDAGEGGDGAHIIVRYTHPETLMQLVVSNYGGDGGAGGAAGSGGRGGDGGEGGEGGRGGPGGWGGDGGDGYRCSNRERQEGCRDGRNGSNGRMGWRGRDGRNGNDGRDGRDGANGSSGASGSDGRNATVRYLNVDADGNVLSESSDIYRLVVQSFGLREENEDSIFAPWERIWATGLTIKNMGAIASPVGAELQLQLFVAGQELNATIVVDNLPSIAAGETLVLEDLELPRISEWKDGDTLSIQSELKFRGINFYGSMASQSVKIQYPIQMRASNFDVAVSAKKSGALTLEIENISTKTIAAATVNYRAEGPLAFQVTSDMKSLAAGEKHMLALDYQQDRPEKSYQDANLNISLFIDSHAAGTKEFLLRSVTDYQFQQADVLVIGDGMRESSYDLFANLMQDLELSLDYYDLDIEAPLSEAAIKKYQGKVVFFAHADVAGVERALPAIRAFTKATGGLALANINEGFSFPSYRDVASVSGENILAQSLEQQKAWAIAALQAAIPFPMKLAKLATYFANSPEEIFPVALERVIADIIREHNFENVVQIYKEQASECFGGQFSHFAAGLDIFDHFALRAKVLSSMSTVTELANQSSERGRLFTKVIRAANMAHRDMVAVSNSCGRIGGTYITANKEKVWLSQPNSNGSFKGEYYLNSGKQRLKGNAESEFDWLLGFQAESKHAATLSCEADLTKVLWSIDAPALELRKINNRARSVQDSDDSWEDCYASGHWRTDRNNNCKETYWPGCSYGGSEGADRCMIID